MLRKFKSSLKKVLMKNRIRNAKLGVTYSLFSGEELLPYSIKCIRENVDYINVVYQKKSWTGLDCSDNLEEILKKLLNDGLIDKIIEYKDFSENVNRKVKQVLHKKNIGLLDLKKNKCTHCLIMDVDELYDSKEFVEAKKFVIENNISHSACNLYNYKYYPELREKNVANYSVPFIFKIRFWSRVSKRFVIPAKVDVLRTISYFKWIDKFYFLNNIVMHHMTGLRIDYLKKLDSTITNYTLNGKNIVENTRVNYEKEKNLSLKELLELENSKYIKVDNKFGIDIYNEKKVDNNKGKKNIPSLFENKSECCGCAACVNICPRNAIKMIEDEEGFLYPYIEKNKCIECNQCIKICPIKK